MRTDGIIILLALICGLFPSTSDGAQVYFRGVKVSKQHAVYGRVMACSRTTATVNLGFAHGVKTNSKFIVCRYRDAKVKPIATFRVRRLAASMSSGFLSSIAKVKPGDYVVIPAGRLDLWEPGARLDRVSQLELVRRRNSNGYDNRDLSSRLVMELAKDDKATERENRKASWGAFVIDSWRFRIAAAKAAGGMYPGLKTDKGETAPKTPNPEKLKPLEGRDVDRIRRSRVGPFGAAFAAYFDQVVFDGEGLNLTEEEIESLDPDQRIGYRLGTYKGKKDRNAAEEGLKNSVKKLFGLDD